MKKKDEKKTQTNRQKQAERSKQKIFDSAQHLFAKYGYNNVTIADICERAGVSTGLFYNYFNAKSEILMFSDGMLATFYKAHSDRFESKDSTIDELVELLSLGVEIIGESPSMLQNARVHYMRACQGTKPSIFDESRKMIQLIKSIVENGRTNGQIKRLDMTVDEITMFLFNHMVGTAIHMLNVADLQCAITHAHKEFEILCSTLTQ